MKKPEDAAAIHVKKALQDSAAAEALSEKDEISDEIIGFHIQQAYEKGLKALLSANKISFRKTHDLRELISIAESNAIEIPRAYQEIDEWTSYGVELRYDDIPVNIPSFNRKKALQNLAAFIQWL